MRNTTTGPREFFRVLGRHRVVSLAVFLLVLGGAVLYVVTATPVYEARVQLLVEASPPNVLALEKPAEGILAREEHYQTQSELFKTRSLARATLARLDLWSDVEFAAREGWLEGMLKGAPPTDRSTTKSDRGPETPAQSRAVDAFLGRIKVTPIRNTQLVTVSFESTDAARAAAVANAIADVYIEEDRRSHQSASNEVAEFLQVQLEAQRRRLEATNLAVEEYRQQHDVPSREAPHDVTVQRVADLNRALTEARTARIEKESVYVALAALGTSPTVEVAPIVAASPVIQNLQKQLVTLREQEAQLSQQLGDRHPDLITLRATIQNRQDELNMEVARRVDGARAELGAAQALEARLARALAGERQAALALGQGAIEFTVLQEEAAGARQLYDVLLERTKEASIVGELNAGTVRVVDRASVPIAPVRPRTDLIFAIALFAACTTALAIPFALDGLDERVSDPDDLPAEFGVALLGVLPRVRRRRRLGKTLLITGGAPEEFAESMRNISATLQLSSQTSGAHCVLFTSADADEGKSTTVSNVAVALVKTGDRILLIDADLRSPRQHEIFDLPLEPGLARVLHGQASLDDVIRRTKVRGLYLVSAGSPSTSPASLLASTPVRKVLSDAVTKFDWVLMDSPPAIAFADALLLARVASAVVLVVNAQRTSRRALGVAVQRLEAASARIVGVVLSRVDLKHGRSPYVRALQRAYGRS